MVFVQKWPFFHLFFLGNIGQENVFYDILHRKNAFVAYKNKKFRKTKNWQFSKGVNPKFWSKIGHFSNFFFLGNIGQENFFYDILEQKNDFLGQKTRSSKSRNIGIFAKGITHSFGPKLAIFKRFFYRQYRPGKFLLRYKKSKKPLSRL